MDETLPSTPLNNTTLPEEFELEELRNIENIEVWGKEHEDLEGQALEELRIFQKNEKEPGEIEENKKDVKVTGGFLDINEYLKSQEDLKKKYEYKRSIKEAESSTKIIFKENKRKKRKSLSNDKLVEDNKKEKCGGSDSDYVPSDDGLSDKEYNKSVNESVKRKRKASGLIDKVIDDGKASCYKQRLNEYYKKMEGENNKEAAEFIKISKHLKISKKIWNNLYSYQRKGVEWLWGLHKQSSGGILGDEMGLGKTVQVIAFLSALSNNNYVSNYCRYTGLGPVIIVSPTTVIHQWVQHFHEWAPEMRVAILHTTGSFTGNKSVLIKDIFKSKGVLVTSYFGVLQFHQELINLDWHYIILDEGHKIRNPQAKITLAVKKFKTPHKLILTGSPMQNNLQELWSLFDFTCPSMLGSLQVFSEHFVSPIIQGGYVNATYEQETTALAMATTLKDMITPYLLRRCKNDLKEDLNLPQKREQVLFCSLSDEQRDLYKEFLKSSHIENILSKNNSKKEGGWFSNQHTRAQVLVGITMLRKICNHPNTYLEELDETKMTIYPEDEQKPYGYYKRSGKMVVVAALLKIWKKQGHRVLLFTQSRSMIKIFEDFLNSEGHTYLKMDGTTSVTSRQGLINKFNNDCNFDVFLLTTRVGGLGVNLTGADRVIIYDPDWNPATDTQARERAWRIGQDKQVTIYRLISAGTIEEKMYQRQVWKQLLSNKILLDPKTQKFFTTSNLYDLFSLQEPISNDSETGNIFKQARVSVQEKLEKKKRLKEAKSKKLNETITFTDDKIEQMKRKAQEIAKNIANKSEDESQKKKYAYEIEDEMEKKHKEAERNYMKNLTPQELMEYNRKKLNENEDTTVNKLDDFDTEASFSQALEVCEKTCSIYHKMREEKLDMDKAQDIYEDITKKVVKKSDELRKNKEKVRVDTSGKVDGEKIENLVKIESKKVVNEESNFNDNQDDYVLGKLFSKKGVHSALQHDVIVEPNVKERKNKFSAYTEAQNKTEVALQALRKSRLRDWRW